MTDTPNRVRETRERRGLSQVELAAASRLTRQSVGAIEAGRSTPAVDVALRIAKALDCRVEELFGAMAPEASILTEAGSAMSGPRALLAEVGGRWIAHPLAAASSMLSADALVEDGDPHALSAQPLRPLEECRENVVFMGCALGLGLLSDRLNKSRGPGRFIWLPTSSTLALEALAETKTHVAGAHLDDPKTGESNVVDARRIAGHTSVSLFTLARWEAGLVVAKRNPKKLREGSDLNRRGLRLVARERGSGARRLLDRSLHAAGLELSRLAGTTSIASGHLEVARAVSMGLADVGVATRDAALAFGLGFVPLIEERYDLALPSSSLEDPRILRLFDSLSSLGFRRELDALGYDVRNSGDRVAQIEAR